MSPRRSLPSGAGIIAGSVALIGFGVDSGIEVISAVGLLWRLRTASHDADVGESNLWVKQSGALI